MSVDNNESSKWTAVYTRPRWEKKVANQIYNLGIQSYCPLTKVKKQWSDRKKVVLEPLFKSYVFVKTTPSELQLLKHLPGISSLVFWLGKPALIKDEEIEAIKDFLAKYENVRLLNSEVELNDKINIVEGPFKYYTGTIIKLMPNTAKVLLPSLGYTLIAELELTNIKKI